VGGLFIVSGLSKIAQPYDFLWAVYDYELLGPTQGLALASALPFLEVALGISLIAGTLERGAWLASIALLSVFTVAKGWVLHEGLKIPCGCVSRPSGTAIDVYDVVLTGLLLLAACVGLAFSVLRPLRHA
jgi:hypothetical protein